METQTCLSLKQSVLSYLNKEVEVIAFDEQHCVLTLPLKTLDNRYIEIFVDPKIGGHFALVHDGGKATAELFAQGIHSTRTKEYQLKAVAERYSVTFADGVFSVGCRMDAIQKAVLSIAQCASLAMHDVLAHLPVIEEEPVASVVRRTLDRWRPSDVDLKHRVHVKGRTSDAEHVFDSVAFPKTAGRHIVAVNTLGPGYPPPIQADRYGFLVLDIEGSDYYINWLRLAVISRVDCWSLTALKQVRSLANKTLETRTGEDAIVERELPSFMRELVA